MAGNSPSEAIENFLAPLGRVIGCVSNRWLVASAYVPYPLDHPRAVLFGGEDSSPVRCRDDLILDVAHYFRVVEAEDDAGPYRCQTLGYAYDFRHVDGPSVIAYHYHPGPDAAVQTPHAHVSQYTRPINLSKVHLPTGRITLEAIVRLAIQEFGTTALRTDYDEVLQESEDAFNQYRDW